MYSNQIISLKDFFSFVNKEKEMNVQVKVGEECLVDILVKLYG